MKIWQVKIGCIVRIAAESEEQAAARALAGLDYSFYVEQVNDSCCLTWEPEEVGALEAEAVKRLGALC